MISIESAGDPSSHSVVLMNSDRSDAPGNPEESLTQATFVDRLIVYISRNPMRDRDVIKKGNQPRKADKEEIKRLIFRNMFLEDKDAAIVKVLWDYFKAVENRWPEAWPHSYEGNILNRTTGFIALMRFSQTQPSPSHEYL